MQTIGTILEINGDRQRTKKGIGDKEQTTTYTYRYLSNRRNKNRIRKQLVEMIRTAEQQMVLSNKEKERELEWLHAQLRKYQQRKYEPPAVHASNRSRGPPLPDTETRKDFKSRIKESTWEIWEGVEGAYTTRDNVYNEMAARQGVILDKRTRAEWHSTVVRKWNVHIKGK